MEEEVGRRGIPSLLRLPSPPENETASLRQEHIASDITQLVGWTPLVELKRIAEKDGINARIVGKLEFYQPLCSIKDRGALRMIEDAEEKGLISPGSTTLVELQVRRGLAVMPAEDSLDKQILLRYLGADVVLTDPRLGFQGQLDKLEQLKKEIPNVHVLDQSANAANPEAHFTWTDLEGYSRQSRHLCFRFRLRRYCFWCRQILKMKNPAVKVICVEPAESPVISGGKPSRHKIQGLGPGFVPKNLDTSVTDEIITVTAEDAMANARRLAKEEGLLVGISSGANLAACLKVASREENKGKMIVTVFPSGGERYMNSDLFAAVREECIAMTF
ncbi:unnamed protein product [Urochloa decumbens]|uniref:Tryptophan synthase beta chain-like PALP domain-containing protein n=1 Tax=Urochloa decumbens TaxID=240449 RepID=A0ABC9DDL5_9POAL